MKKNGKINYGLTILYFFCQLFIVKKLKHNIHSNKKLYYLQMANQVVNKQIELDLYEFLRDTSLYDFPNLELFKDDKNLKSILEQCIENKFQLAGSDERIKYLEKNKNIKWKDYLLLRHVMWDKDRTTFKFIIENFIFPLNILDNFIFRHCCKNGWTDYVKKYLENNNVQPFDVSSMAVYYAITSEDDKMIDTLFSNDRYVFGYYCNQAFLEGCSNGYLYAVKRLLQKHTDDYTKHTIDRGFYLACVLGRYDTAKYLQTQFPNINPKGALMKASCNGFVKIMSLLIDDMGVNPACDNNSALAIAVKQARIECVEFLLQYPQVDPVNAFCYNETDINYPIEFSSTQLSKSAYRQITKELLKTEKNRFDF